MTNVMNMLDLYERRRDRVGYSQQGGHMGMLHYTSSRQSRGHSDHSSNAVSSHDQRTHVSQALEKLGLRDRTQLAVFYFGGL